MTSHDPVPNGITRAHVERVDKMREYRRPTLCVIDENGAEVASGICADDSDDIKISFDNLAIRDLNSNLTKFNGSDVLTIPEPEKDSDLDFSKLKATTTRLNLTTRRPSTVAWQQQYLNKSTIHIKPNFDIDKNADKDDDCFTEERKNRINEALAWLRQELQEMRSQDESLARTLLSIRHDIQQLKLQRTCKEHREMLDDVAMDIEEESQMSDICDTPILDSVNDSPLKHLGVTRMNLSARRFSTC